MTAGCGLLNRSEVLRSEHVALDGYAYDAELERVGNAHLELDVEVVRFQRFRQEPQTQLRGQGSLAIAGNEYRVVLPKESPSFLNSPAETCEAYYSGGGQRAHLGNEEVTIDLLVSESLGAAYGLIQLEPTPGSRVDDRGYSGVCFDDKGKTNWEIYKIDNSSLVAFDLGPDASSLEELRDYRDRGPK